MYAYNTGTSYECASFTTTEINSSSCKVGSQGQSSTSCTIIGQCDMPHANHQMTADWRLFTTKRITSLLPLAVLPDTCLSTMPAIRQSSANRRVDASDHPPVQPPSNFEVCFDSKQVFKKQQGVLGTESGSRAMIKVLFLLSLVSKMLGYHAIKYKLPPKPARHLLAKVMPC